MDFDFDMLEFYEIVRKHNINIIYSGPIWGDVVEGIGTTIRKRLELDELPLTAAKSVFAVFVEQMNNILMYSAEKHTDNNKEFAVSSGVFVLSTQDKVYYLRTGNVMHNDNVQLLKSLIDHLNSLDKEGLKKHYKEQIRNENNNPNSLGAGIGLTEIAKRASSKITYSFKPYGENLSFFSMFVTIGDEDEKRGD